MNPVVVVHHHEITLKRDNRGAFERQLLRNVRAALAGLVPAASIGGGYGRFVILPGADASMEDVEHALSGVFGIANICAGIETKQEIGAICGAAAHLLDGREFRTIRVDTRRPDKSFPVRSMEVNARVGEFLCTRYGVRADLSTPDETVFVEIVNRTAYVYRSKLPGPGGLPSGASGKVVSLLSAGIDSPVASWRMMKRGATVVFVHFHSMPYTSRESVEQVRRLVRVLTRFQFRSRLILVPFADAQNRIVVESPQRLRVLLYRRLMIRIAGEFARREKAEALVTGEAVGQVASQTLRNIRVIDAAAVLPVLRPLAGMDKEETVAQARAIGTFDISIEPYDDCCSYLAPRNPETWASPEDVDAAEAALPVADLAESACSAAGVESFTHTPPIREPAVGLAPG